MLNSEVDSSSTLDSSVVEESARTQTRYVPSGRTNMFSRLQALLPSNPSAEPTSAPIDTSLPRQRGPLVPKFLKVRIMTWNMHESLPKGDLVELLGRVTPISQATEKRPLLTSIPYLSADGDHPYHLVVVAGQECPSQSGIPLGLGAGFKLKDKEKEAPQEPEPGLPSSSYGWTAILEDWYYFGGKCARGIDKKRGLRHIWSIPDSLSTATDATSDLKRQRTVNSPQKWMGPYEILIKERMMGLYLAVYIHRDIKHLVRGMSKSAVTAGLIGGRVGNKGGIGISINLDGTTLLFINAHLAAHEGKVLHRLHDMQKIKTTLLLDDWLDKDDPRVMGEDLTDRFDYSFIFGDLNFRLDISRLHADWLISRKDYAQALAFDQLQDLMRKEEAFVGFNEAPIDFPPTFKYDVLRTIKRHKTKSRRPGKHFGDNHFGEMPLVEAQERDHEMDDEDGEGDEGGEATSVASSAFTSVHSKIATDQGLDGEDHSMASKASRASTGNLIGKVLAVTAAQKAKERRESQLQLEVLGRLFLSKPVGWSAKLKRFSLNGSSHSPYVPSVPSTVLSTRSAPFLPSPSVDRSTLSSSSYTDPPNTGTPRAQGEEDVEDGDGGFYDTSSKQRVPSWCDRILWKSTIKPDSEPDSFSSSPKNRVGQFFANAFRLRAKKTSSIDIQRSASPHKEVFRQPSSLDNIGLPFSRPTRFSSLLRRPNSIDGVSRSAKLLDRSASDSKTKKRASTGLSLPRSKTVPAALESSPDTPLARPQSLLAENANHPPSIPPKEAYIPSMRRFLPFLHRNASQSALVHDQPPTPESALQRPRKGDVVCLSYNSLDDGGMRRLEGRSDHRPVIGSYAIYI